MTTVFEIVFSAYLPDLPGYVFPADTIEETEPLVQETIEIYIRGIQEEGLEIPQSTLLAREIEVVQ